MKEVGVEKNRRIKEKGGRKVEKRMRKGRRKYVKDRMHIVTTYKGGTNDTTSTALAIPLFATTVFVL